MVHIEVVAAIGAVLAGLALLVCLRLTLGTMDGARIRTNIESQGGQLLDSEWTPFGRGWFGSAHERIYTVRYRDSAGNLHEATCKTSLFAGVYFTEDGVVEPGAPTHVESLEDENRRLRAELEQFRRSQKGGGPT